MASVILTRIASTLLLLILLAMCQIAALLAPLRAFWAIFANPVQAFEILKGYDRLGNAVTNGRSNETISSRADRARSEKRRWGCVLCRILDYLDPGHCEKSKGT